MQFGIYPTLKDLESKERSKKLLEDEVTKWYKSHIHLPSEKQSPVEDGQGKMLKKYYVNIIVHIYYYCFFVCCYMYTVAHYGISSEKKYKHIAVSSFSNFL